MSKSNYNWDANLYNRFSSFQVKAGLETINRLSPQKSERILDVGCGSATLTIELAKLVSNGEVIGIDNSKDMLENARLSIKNSGIKNIKIINMDAVALNFENEFDAIFSNWVIHWIENIQLLFDSFYKCLKKNGRLVALIYKKVGISDQLGYKMLKLMRKSELKPYYRNFKIPFHNRTEEVYHRILRESGFLNVKTEPYNFIAKFNTREELINHNRAAGLVPFLSPLPEELKITYMKYFEDIVNQILPDSNQLTFHTLFLSGEKK